MRHGTDNRVFFGLSLLLAGLGSSAAAQNFYGTGSSYTGQKLPIQTLNAIDAEQRNQSAREATIRAKQQQLLNDRRRALTSGTNLNCQGKTAALTTCATQPMPQYDRRANTLDQDSHDAARQSEERLRRLQTPQ